MDPELLALAFDRWMDDWLANPERFEHEWQSALRHQAERLDGKQPSYGRTAAAMLLGYLSNLTSPRSPAPPPTDR